MDLKPCQKKIINHETNKKNLHKNNNQKFYLPYFCLTFFFYFIIISINIAKILKCINDESEKECEIE